HQVHAGCEGIGRAELVDLNRAIVGVAAPLPGVAEAGTEGEAVDGVGEAGREGVLPEAAHAAIGPVIGDTRFKVTKAQVEAAARRPGALVIASQTFLGTMVPLPGLNSRRNRQAELLEGGLVVD